MNQDNYYAIEIKICSKNGWSTPQEAMSIWYKYSRDGVTEHWWGDGTGANNHDNIVNFFLGQANAGIKSVNYVVSDNKITLMVSPDNVAWCSSAGNPTTISVEHQPTLGPEGYKKSGWLHWQLEGRYNKRLSIYPHSHWAQTSCPGSIDLGRIRSEADKWASGGYAPAPVPAPQPVPIPPQVPVIQIAYSKLPKPVSYIFNKDADLWDFNTASWSGFTSVKKFKKGELFSMYGIADNVTLHAKYGMTAYSFGTADTTGVPKATNGVNMADLNIVPSTTPIPPAVPVPPPIQVEPPVTPTPPVEPVPDQNAIVVFLTAIKDMIIAFLAKLKK